MFTGLIEANGELTRVERRGPGVTITLRAPRHLVSELTLGESVAVDGACLTVTTFGGEHFTVDASAETMTRTTLGASSAKAITRIASASGPSIATPDPSAPIWVVPAPVSPWPGPPGQP